MGNETMNSAREATAREDGLRQRTEALFRETGWLGCWPVFSKRIITRGFTLRESHGEPLVILPLQRANVTALCRRDSGGVVVEFATDRTGGNASPGDCVDREGGGVLYTCGVLTDVSDNSWETDWDGDLERGLRAAIKEAELQPMTRGERALLLQRHRTSLGTFLLFLFFGSIFLAMPLTLAAVLAEDLMHLILSAAGLTALFSRMGWNTIHLVLTILFMLLGFLKAAYYTDLPRSETPERNSGG